MSALQRFYGSSKLNIGTNDSVTQGRDQYLPLSTFTANMKTMFDALTSPSSPYAVADSPVSIILITPGPPLHSQMPEDRRPGRSVARTGAFRDEVIRLFHEWKALEAQQTLVKGEWGWKVSLVDFWGELVKDAGGIGEELAPYYL